MSNINGNKQNRVFREANYADFNNYSGIKNNPSTFKKAGQALGIIPKPNYDGLYNKDAKSSTNSYQNPLFNENNVEDDDKVKEIRALASASITKALFSNKMFWTIIGSILLVILVVILFFTMPAFKNTILSFLTCSSQDEQCIGECTICSGKIANCC
jgi:hypothetical protein